MGSEQKPGVRATFEPIVIINEGSEQHERLNALAVRNLLNARGSEPQGKITEPISSSAENAHLLY